MQGPADDLGGQAGAFDRYLDPRSFDQVWSPEKV